MENKIKTFDVSGEGLYEHEIGYEKCQEGWCDGGWGYPRKCDCGGLIHADFGDEDWDCNYWLHTKCDKCGDTLEHRADRWKVFCPYCKHKDHLQRIREKPILELNHEENNIERKRLF